MKLLWIPVNPTLNVPGPMSLFLYLRPGLEKWGTLLTSGVLRILFKGFRTLYPFPRVSGPFITLTLILYPDFLVD